jgi:ribonuclease J
VELSAGGKRILLDLGKPLEPVDDEKASLPQVSGLLEPGEDLLGVVLSHPHQDHWGLIPLVRKDIPVFLGQAAERILREGSFFGAGQFDPTVGGYLEDRTPLQVGPFRITPFLNDHSAFDAYSLLIEADEKRIFYTGDFRAHGRKKSLFERLLHDAPEDIDVLLTEGTSVSPDGQHRDIGLTEGEVETELMRLFDETPNAPVLVAMSAQNIDRLVSVFRACLQTNRTLVVDLYAAAIAKATGRSTIPQPGFENYKVWVPQPQRVRVKKSGQFHRVEEIRPLRVYPESDFARLAPDAVFLFRQSMAQEFERAGCLDNGLLIWSMWDGYLRPPEGDSTRSFVARNGLRLEHCHSSGHAGIDDIQRLVTALKPRRVVPMHTFGAAQFSRVLNGIAQVELHNDGLWWDV